MEVASRQKSKYKSRIKVEKYIGFHWGIKDLSRRYILINYTENIIERWNNFKNSFKDVECRMAPHVSGGQHEK